VSVNVSDRAVGHDYATVIRRPDDDADDATRLAFVLDEAIRTQERLNELVQRIEHEHVRRVNALNELRSELDAAIAQGIETSRLKFVQLRRIGLVFLWFGASCLTAANLV
jgi:hypothetical protein